MESFSMILSSSPLIQHHSKTHKSTSQKSACLLPSFSNSTSKDLPLVLQNAPFLKTLAKPHLSFPLINLFASLPCLASEAVLPSTEPISDKINLETILVSIDEFLNRYPFFVATCTFVWLVVIPVTQGYLSKCKFVSAIDAFKKLKNEPTAGLLDIRNTKTLVSLGSPNLRSLNKSVVQVEFTEGGKDGFLKNVLDNFADPANTILCILDNFDGNSLTVAKLLFKNGFKEAYAIEGGVRGKNGWLAIQEKLLPPSVHIVPKKKKKVKVSQKLGVNGVDQQDKNGSSSSRTLPIVENAE